MRTATQLFRLDEFLTWILAFYVLALFLDKVVLESLERRFFAWRRGAEVMSVPTMSPQRVWRSFRRGPLAGRLLFPVVCLLIWVLSIKLVTTIWPFAVDVLPTPCR